MNKTIKFFILPVLFLAVFLLLTTPTNYVFASSDYTITLFGEGSFFTKPTSAEIFGIIECVDLDEDNVKDCIESKKNELKNTLIDFENCSLEITYDDTYPISSLYRNHNAYKAQINFVIKLSHLDNISQIVDEISSIKNASLSSINLITNDGSATIEALKQAITKAELKANSLLGAQTNILEIKEIEQYNCNNLYLSFNNIDLQNLPTIEIKAKVEIEFAIE